MELLTALALVGLLASIAIPPLARLREAAAVDSGRSQVTAALSLSRSVGSRWGRTAVLLIDTVQDVLTLRVDTTGLFGTAEYLVVREFWLGADLGVDLGANRSAICFNSRGVGTTGPECPETGALITLKDSERVDTIRINSAGRVW